MPVPVTEQEMRSPLYKYFEMDRTPPSPELIELYKNAVLTPDTALKAQDMNLLLEEGYLPGEIGSCLMDDGTATVAGWMPMPGVTVEMFDWWFAWHGLEPLRYKIWDKYNHRYCMTRNPERALDTSLSMKERYWDTTHDVQETMFEDGYQKNLVINFRNPVDVGFSPEKLRTFNGTVVCSGNENTPTIMAHVVRPTADGVELRTRFWLGYGAVDKKPVKMLPDGEIYPIQRAIDMVGHYLYEYSNLAALLPRIYPEYKDKF